MEWKEAWVEYDEDGDDDWINVDDGHDDAGVSSVLPLKVEVYRVSPEEAGQESASDASSLTLA